MTKRKLTLVISLLVLAIMIGGGAMHLYNKHKQEELKRNREYEVSLVKALKNSYEGIEEIEISNPNYTSPPGDWSCDIVITFEDGEKISYRIAQNLDDKQNYGGRMGKKGDSNEEINKKWNELYERKGVTANKVKIVFSNNEKGKE